jgi:hypothetical protein
MVCTKSFSPISSLLSLVFVLSLQRESLRLQPRTLRRYLSIEYLRDENIELSLVFTKAGKLIIPLIVPTLVAGITHRIYLFE